MELLDQVLRTFLSQMCIRDRGEVGRQFTYVDVGNRNTGAQAVEHQNEQREEDLLAQLGDLPGITAVSYTHLVVGEDLRAEAHSISCGDGGGRPDFQRQLVLVCHVAYTGVFYGVVHLVDGRIDRIHGDSADGHVGRLVLIGRDVSCLLYTSATSYKFDTPVSCGA